VTSDEDEKSRTRQEVISSFLDGERSYVTLLSSLVHVSFNSVCSADTRQFESVLCGFGNYSTCTCNSHH